MKTAKYFSKNQRGMTGLETAIILIAFVTVAAVFGYAILSAGLFSAERGKETIYAGLNEAQSNLELSGSVIAMADNATPTQVGKIKFTVKNAIAGNPIDMTPNGVDPRSVDQTGKNKCIISLATHDDYFNNVAWTFAPIGHDNGNNLLETGEQFEITIDVSGVNVCMNDSGRILSLGALVCGPNLGDLLFGGGNSHVGPTLQANDTFTLQVKPSVGASITILRTLPPAIGPVMDLDLMTSFGNTGTGIGGGGGGSTQQAISVSPLTLGFGSVLVSQTSTAQPVTVSNTGTANLAVGVITLGGANANQFAISSDTASNQTIAPGTSRIVNVTFNPTSTGAKSADLSIPSNDPVNNPVTVALSGDGTPPLTCTKVLAYWSGHPNLDALDLFLDNTGTSSANISPSGVTIAVDGGAAVVPSWWVAGGYANPFAPGETCVIILDLSTSPIVPLGHTVTLTITPDGGTAVTVTKTVPGSLNNGFTQLP